MLQKGLLIRKAETEKVEDLMVLPWTRLRVLKGMGGGGGQVCRGTGGQVLIGGPGTCHL